LFWNYQQNINITKNIVQTTRVFTSSLTISRSHSIAYDLVRISTSDNRVNAIYLQIIILCTQRMIRYYYYIVVVILLLRQETKTFILIVYVSNLLKCTYMYYVYTFHDLLMTCLLFRSLWLLAQSDTTKLLYCK